MQVLFSLAILVSVKETGFFSLFCNIVKVCSKLTSQLHGNSITYGNVHTLPWTNTELLVGQTKRLVIYVYFS